MPTTVADAFSVAGLSREAVVPWGTRPTTQESGVYIASLTRRLDAVDETMSEPPLSIAAFERWLLVRPELKLDGVRPSVEQLMERIRRFWLPDETILYVGLATSLSSRVGSYYSTPIGNRSPHAGGYFLKLLSNLGDLWVHYARCVEFEKGEHEMLRRFCEGVSSESKATLLDPAHPFPFANLVWPKGIRKLHGLSGATEPRKGKTKGEA